jgi:hypothetical protein
MVDEAAFIALGSYAAVNGRAKTVGEGVVDFVEDDEAGSSFPNPKNLIGFITANWCHASHPTFSFTISITTNRFRRMPPTPF